jgi:hypothetical protein
MMKPPTGNRRTGTQLFSKKVSLSPLTHTQAVTYSHPPRFQETNLETLLVEGAGARDGVIVNEDGEVTAFWGSFSEQVCFFFFKSRPNLYYFL